jgi:hypothetical protein
VCGDREEATMKRLVMTVALGTALVPAAGATASPVIREYSGQTSQGAGVMFEVGADRRLDMAVGLEHPCSFGGTFRDSTHTDPTDHYHVARDGRFAIKGSFAVQTTNRLLRQRGDRFVAHFVMKGRFVRGRAVGWVSEAIVVWRGHRQRGGCQTPPTTFSAD